jgi:hypothetical protein
MDFSTMADTPASHKALHLSKLAVNPELAAIIGFFSLSPAKVVSKFVISESV